MGRGRRRLRAGRRPASPAATRIVGGVGAVVPVDLHIRGCPPRPIELLAGLLALLETAK